MRMGRKVMIAFLVTSFTLAAVMIIPLQYQDRGSTYEPTGKHGGM